jgi:hypothetical protein
MKPCYQSPESDNGYVETMHDAPDTATVLSQADGHIVSPDSETSPEAFDAARNYRKC